MLKPAFVNPCPTRFTTRSEVTPRYTLLDGSTRPYRLLGATAFCQEPRAASILAASKPTITVPSMTVTGVVI